MAGLISDKVKNMFKDVKNAVRSAGESGELASGKMLMTGVAEA